MILTLLLALPCAEPAVAAVASRAATIAIAAPAAVARGAPLEVEIPKNDGWVTDLAGMLSPDEERELEALMESYRQGSKHDIALLTVNDLGGQAIEPFALEVARAWKLGGQDTNDGALLVVSKNDRMMRIEVGRGLEGNLTDSISGRIIRDVIAPEFKRGRFAAGLNAGIRAMHAAIGGEYASLPKERKVEPGGVIGAVVFFLILVVIVIIIVANNHKGPGGRRRRGFGPMIFGPGSFGSMGTSGRSSGGGFGGFSGGGGFSGFGGGGGFSGGGASGRW